MLFNQLGLIAPIAQALAEEGYTQPTPIQAQAIPHLLQGADLLGCAQTGTGKTAAFALPILQKLHSAGTPKGPRQIRALILTPTRELAIQIEESLRAYGRHLPLRHLVIFGGVGQQPQVEALKRGVDILVATPGRLLDLMQQGFIQLQHLEVFVLDEADRMLDMGFIHDVKKVIAKLPPRRQSLFFSATMPPDVAALANTILQQPVSVAVTPVSSTADTVGQQVYMVEKNQKRHLLLHLLQSQPQIESVLVFTRTKHGADRVAKDLVRAGVKAQAIHGNKSQNARQDALKNFKSGATRVLVATDIAARGIDIDDLGYVVNFELPNVPETYVHRIGRTGRAGASGQAISFCQSDERPYLRDIEKLIGKKIPKVTEHAFVGQDAPETTAAQTNNQQLAPPNPQTSQRRQPQGPVRQQPTAQGRLPHNAQPRQPQKTVRQAASNQPAPLPMQAQTQETRKPLVLSAKKNTANGIHNQPPHNKRQPAAPMPKKRPPQPVIERNFNTLDESQNHAPLPVQKRKWHNRGGYVEVPQPPQPKPLFDDADRW